MWVLANSSEFINVNYERAIPLTKFIGSSIIRNGEYIFFPFGKLNSSFVLGETFINYIPLDDRIGGYLNYLNFTTREKDITFCPLSLNLGDWPNFFNSIVYEKIGASDYLLNHYGKEIENITITSNFAPYGNKLYFDKSLILFGNNGSKLILIKPHKIEKTTQLKDQYFTEILKEPTNDDYFFKINILNRNIVASICTNKSNDNLDIFEGPKFYFFPNYDDAPEIQNLLPLLLSKSIEVELGMEQHISEYIGIRGFMDDISSLEAEIKPEINIRREPFPFANCTFHWNTTSGQDSLLFHDGEQTMEFHNYVILSGSHFEKFAYEKMLYPFDNYEGRIMVECVSPPYLKKENHSVSFMDAPQYGGDAIFNKNSIRIEIYPKSCYIVFISIYYIFAFFIIKKYKNNRLHSKLGILVALHGLFFFNFIPVERIISLATIPYIGLCVYLFHIEIRDFFRNVIKKICNLQQFISLL